MKFINLLKRHKGLAIVGALTLVLLIIMFIIFSRMIFSTGKTEYGDRLKNIVDIPKEDTNKAISETEGLEQVKSVKVRNQGKIIYVTITYTDGTSKDKAKEIASKIPSYYDEDVIGCYDFEFLLTQEEKLDDEGNNLAYTIAGTKHPDRENISWTRN